MADHQTAGRGRLGRTWEAPPGSNLLCSVLLRPSASSSAPSSLFFDVARVSLSARDAALSVAGVDARLKWPNDLVVVGGGGRVSSKLAGVLAEVDAPPSSGGAGGAGVAVVVGVGMNVGWAPPGAARLGDGVSRDDVLHALLASLDGWLVADVRMVLRAYREACVTLGSRVRVELLDGETFEGVAADIADSGALLVETSVCLREVSAGDVVHLR